MRGEQFPHDLATRQEIMCETAAHEIGHVMIGVGHPNYGKADSTGEKVGLAALRGCDFRDLEKRLMFQGAAPPGIRGLLVKREWDEIESWLKSVIDQQPQ